METQLKTQIKQSNMREKHLPSAYAQNLSPVRNKFLREVEIFVGCQPVAYFAPHFTQI